MLIVIISQRVVDANRKATEVVIEIHMELDLKAWAERLILKEEVNAESDSAIKIIALIIAKLVETKIVITLPKTANNRNMEEIIKIMEIIITIMELQEALHLQLETYPSQIRRRNYK